MLNKMMKKFHNKKGFTMIELIAVMAVIAVLITILLPQVSALRERSIKTEASKVAKDVFQAIQTYDLENGDVPADVAELTDGGYTTEANRTEYVSVVTASTLNFTYMLKKQGYIATVTYDGATKTFDTVIKKSDVSLPAFFAEVPTI